MPVKLVIAAGKCPYCEGAGSFKTMASKPTGALEQGANGKWVPQVRLANTVRLCTTCKGEGRRGRQIVWLTGGPNQCN